jgi:oxygen-independent coproporphyrinogen-3 oxidase
VNEREPATAVGADPKRTEVGSSFVSNYPPYSFWTADRLPAVDRALETAPAGGVPLGLYLHVPFCRKRCKFCYFKVFTDKNAGQVESYLDAVAREAELYAERAAVTGRSLEFVYFGGGTPSYISARHLRGVVAALRERLSWDGVREVTFECEPGTLTRAKLEAIRDVGVTRLSLGVENFNDAILEENGRAHTSKEIFRVAPWIRELGFDQLNVDLISGMVGETWETWRDSVRRTIEMDADSVTIYQMELPYNTVYSKQLLGGGRVGVADWETKRAWHDFAFRELEAAGFELSSAYTMVRAGRGVRFVYRDSVWRGCDLLGLGLSSFSHVGGVHFQNLAGWNDYLARIAEGALAVDRAFEPAAGERLTRELILQLKRGYLEPDYFREKYGAEILELYRAPFEKLRERGMLVLDRGRIELTRQGLLRVDQLLPELYDPRYQNARYT